MLLHLIRHAKTNQISPTGKDYDRELLPRGWRQCKELDLYLSTLKLSDADVVCSGAKRARETLLGIESNFQEENLSYTDDLYLCAVKDYLKIIWSNSSSENFVLVGHNFGISDLANYFLDTFIEMKTSEYVCIEFPFDSWELAFQSTGIMKTRFRPEAR